MVGDYTICVGTVGAGISRSPDGGETWERIISTLDPECDVRALTLFPNDPHRVLAGSEQGVYLSDDNGAIWEKLDSPMAGQEVWSIGIDPTDTNTIFVGARPDVFRSRNGGQSWDKLPVGVSNPCPIGIPKVTVMMVDPRDRRTIWAGIEVDGIYKSLDGGDSWLRLPEMGSDAFYGDIHGMDITPGATTSIYATTPYGIGTSTDEGESWQWQEFPLYHPEDRWSYCRGMMRKSDDPNTIFVGNGESFPKMNGAIQMTKDGGRTWAPVPLPVKPNSYIYWFTSHASVPNVIIAASHYGELYKSVDGGTSWEKLEQQFGEIRTLALMPN